MTKTQIALGKAPIMAGFLAAVAVFAALFFNADAKAADLQPYATGEMQNFKPVDTPRTVAAATFSDKSGKKLDLSAFKGRVTLVNIWATWCIPCLVEMPALDALQGEFGGADFEVVAVSQERSVEKAENYLSQVKARYLNLYVDDSLKSARLWGAYGLPTTFLLNRDGMEIGRLVGPAKWSSPEAKALIKAAIAAK